MTSASCNLDAAVAEMPEFRSVVVRQIVSAAFDDTRSARNVVDQVMQARPAPEMTVVGCLPSVSELGSTLRQQILFMEDDQQIAQLVIAELHDVGLPGELLGCRRPGGLEKAAS